MFLAGCFFSYISPTAMVISPALFQLTQASRNGDRVLTSKVGLCHHLYCSPRQQMIGFCCTAKPGVTTHLAKRAFSHRHPQSGLGVSDKHLHSFLNGGDGGLQPWHFPASILVARSPRLCTLRGARESPSCLFPASGCA